MFKAVSYHPDECQIVTVGTDRKVGRILQSSFAFSLHFDFDVLFQALIIFEVRRWHITSGGGAKKLIKFHDTWGRRNF